MSLLETMRSPEFTPLPVAVAWRRYLVTVRKASKRPTRRPRSAWRELTAELARLGRPLSNEPR